MPKIGRNRIERKRRRGTSRNDNESDDSNDESNINRHKSLSDDSDDDDFSKEESNDEERVVRKKRMKRGRSCKNNPNEAAKTSSAKKKGGRSKNKAVVGEDDSTLGKSSPIKKKKQILSSSSDEELIDDDEPPTKTRRKTLRSDSDDDDEEEEEHDISDEDDSEENQREMRSNKGQNADSDNDKELLDDDSDDLEKPLIEKKSTKEQKKTIRKSKYNVADSSNSNNSGEDAKSALQTKKAEKGTGQEDLSDIENDDNLNDVQKLGDDENENSDDEVEGEAQSIKKSRGRPTKKKHLDGAKDDRKKRQKEKRKLSSKIDEDLHEDDVVSKRKRKMSKKKQNHALESDSEDDNRSPLANDEPEKETLAENPSDDEIRSKNDDESNDTNENNTDDNSEKFSEPQAKENNKISSHTTPHFSSNLMKEALTALTEYLDPMPSTANVVDSIDSEKWNAMRDKFCIESNAKAEALVENITMLNNEDDDNNDKSFEFCLLVVAAFRQSSIKSYASVVKKLFQPKKGIKGAKLLLITWKNRAIQSLERKHHQQANKSSQLNTELFLLVELMHFMADCKIIDGPKQLGILKTKFDLDWQGIIEEVQTFIGNFQNELIQEACTRASQRLSSILTKSKDAKESKSESKVETTQLKHPETEDIIDKNACQESQSNLSGKPTLSGAISRISSVSKVKRTSITAYMGLKKTSNLLSSVKPRSDPNKDRKPVTTPQPKNEDNEKTREFDQKQQEEAKEARRKLLLKMVGNANQKKKEQNFVETGSPSRTTPQSRITPGQEPTVGTTPFTRKGDNHQRYSVMDKDSTYSNSGSNKNKNTLDGRFVPRSSDSNQDSTRMDCEKKNIVENNSTAIKKPPLVNNSYQNGADGYKNRGDADINYSSKARFDGRSAPNGEENVSSRVQSWGYSSVLSGNSNKTGLACRDDSKMTDAKYSTSNMPYAAKSNKYETDPTTSSWGSTSENRESLIGSRSKWESQPPQRFEAAARSAHDNKPRDQRRSSFRGSVVESSSIDNKSTILNTNNQIADAATGSNTNASIQQNNAFSNRFQNRNDESHVSYDSKRRNSSDQTGIKATYQARNNDWTSSQAQPQQNVRNEPRAYDDCQIRSGYNNGNDEGQRYSDRGQKWTSNGNNYNMSDDNNRYKRSRSPDSSWYNNENRNKYRSSGDRSAKKWTGSDSGNYSERNRSLDHPFTKDRYSDDTREKEFQYTNAHNEGIEKKRDFNKDLDYPNEDRRHLDYQKQRDRWPREGSQNSSRNAEWPNQRNDDYSRAERKQSQSSMDQQYQSGNQRWPQNNVSQQERKDFNSHNSKKDFESYDSRERRMNQQDGDGGYNYKDTYQNDKINNWLSDRIQQHSQQVRQYDSESFDKERDRHAGQNLSRQDQRTSYLPDGGKAQNQNRSSRSSGTFADAYRKNDYSEGKSTHNSIKKSGPSRKQDGEKQFGETATRDNEKSFDNREFIRNSRDENNTASKHLASRAVQSSNYQMNSSSWNNSAQERGPQESRGVANMADKELSMSVRYEGYNRQSQDLSSKNNNRISPSMREQPSRVIDAGRGRGRGMTLPAWMTRGETDVGSKSIASASPVMQPSNQLSGMQPRSKREGTAPSASSSSRMQPRSQHDKVAASDPLSSRRTHLDGKKSIERNFGTQSDSLNYPGMARGRGRGKHVNLPAWMTRQEDIQK